MMLTMVIILSLPLPLCVSQFTKYLRMNEAAIFAYFLIDCARYRSAPASKRQRQASEIRSKYLVEGKNGSDIGGKFPVSLCRNRPLPSSGTETSQSGTSKSSATSAATTTSDSTSEWVVDSSIASANALGLSGPLVDALKTAIEQHMHMPSTAPPPPSLFDEVDDVVFSLTAHKFDNFKDSPFYQKFVNIRIQLQKPVAYKDFQLFRTLGRGGFGLVNGCKKTQSGQLYAMKALCRKRIKLKKAADLCLNEKSILQLIHSPFIVCLQYAFTTPQDVYLVLDLMVGGDLGFYLHRTTAGAFSAVETKYFVARTVLGLKALHDAR